MKIYALLLGLLLAAGCAHAPAASHMPAESASAAIDGKWEGTFEGMGQSMKLGYDFKADGNMLTGTTTGPQGNTMDIKNGKINGNKISFDVPVDMGQMKMTVKYTGVLSGDELALTMEMDMGEGGPGGGMGGPPGGGEAPPMSFTATRVMEAE